MSDYWFPKDIKPLINKTYSLTRGGNIISSGVQGGLPRQRKRFSRDAVPFTLNFSVDQYHMNIFLQFYDVVIDGGANSFKMMLDSGTGIVEHQVRITSQPSITLSGGYRWYISFTATADVTPSQLNACSNLYGLSQCYSKQELCGVINGLESFVTEIPHNE